jgi:hypothetical protein
MVRPSGFPVQQKVQGKKRKLARVARQSCGSKLSEATVANLAAPDKYAQWLLAQRGTVSPDLDLEF